LTGRITITCIGTGLFCQFSIGFQNVAFLFFCFRIRRVNVTCSICSRRVVVVVVVVVVPCLRHCRATLTHRTGSTVVTEGTSGTVGRVIVQLLLLLLFRAVAVTVTGTGTHTVTVNGTVVVRFITKAIVRFILYRTSTSTSTRTHTATITILFLSQTIQVTRHRTCTCIVRVYQQQYNYR
jgi:hypothetical protein